MRTLKFLLILMFLGAPLGAWEQYLTPRVIPFTGGTLTSDLTMSDGTIIELATGSASNLSLRLRSDQDTGFYSPGSNQLRIRVGGYDNVSFQGGNIYLSRFVMLDSMTSWGNNNTGYPRVQSFLASSTYSSFGWVNDDDSGLGRAAVGRPCLISDGVECVSVASSGTQIFQQLTYPYYTASSTTPVATTTYYTTGWSFTADGILVDIGGVIQSGGGIDYTETPPNLITFASEVATGSRVTIRNR